jgi:hypothetical protein
MSKGTPFSPPRPGHGARDWCTRGLIEREHEIRRMT